MKHGLEERMCSIRNIPMNIVVIVETNSEKIQFPEDKTWKDYVRDNRLEITCGEAPYIVSRYDTTTGETILLRNASVCFDRKLRVVGENTETSGEWFGMGAGSI